MQKSQAGVPCHLGDLVLILLYPVLFYSSEISTQVGVPFLNKDVKVRGDISGPSKIPTRHSTFPKHTTFGCGEMVTHHWPPICLALTSSKPFNKIYSFWCDVIGLFGLKKDIFFSVCIKPTFKAFKWLVKFFQGRSASTETKKHH